MQGYLTTFLLLLTISTSLSNEDSLFAEDNENSSEGRDLIALETMWRVNIDSTAKQAFTFSTGPGGPDPAVKVLVYDKCRIESSERTGIGQLYPYPSVTGLNVDTSGASTIPGPGNTISFNFAENIDENTYIYERGPGTSAKVTFCAQVGMYENRELINLAEVKFGYNIDLATNFSTLDGYMVVQDEGYVDTGGGEVVVDEGELLTYFCNPDSKEPLTDGALVTQGSLVSICLAFPGGQFQVKDVLDLTIEETSGWPYQVVMFFGYIQFWSTPYATTYCGLDATSTTNVCVLSFLLNSEFYDYSVLTLSGYGVVVLEFDDGSRRLEKEFRTLQDSEENYVLPPVEFQMVYGSGSRTFDTLTSLVLSTIVATWAGTLI